MDGVFCVSEGRHISDFSNIPSMKESCNCHVLKMTVKDQDVIKKDSKVFYSGVGGCVISPLGSFYP